MSVGRKRAPRFHAGDRVSFLFGLEKVTGEILEDRGPLGAYGRRLYRVRINAGQEDEATFEIPEADIEPSDPSAKEDESPGLRQQFAVSYIREGHTNHWQATTKRGQLYKGVKAKGAIGYTSGRWGSEAEGDERFARVTVFVVCDPASCNSRGHVRATAWPTLTATAREMADVMFRREHPGAIIKHLDSSDTVN